MTNQEEFIKKLSEINELALDQDNVIFEDQLYDIFPELKDNENQKKIILEYLQSKNIGLNEKIAAEDIMTEEEKTYLSFYMEDLEATEPLTKNQREGYLLSAMSGDKNAQDIIVNDSLKTVVDIAKLYVGQGVMIEDLIGEGNIALITTVPTLGECENAKEAEAMLSEAIMDSMQDFVASEMDVANGEEKLLKKVNKVAKEAKELAKVLGRKVTVEELSLETKMSKDKIIEALKLTANAIEDIEIPEELK